MLDDVNLKALDPILLGLRRLLAREDYSGAQTCVRQVMQYLICRPEVDDVHTDCVLRPDWQATWRRIGCITTSWFRDLRGDVAAQGLYDLVSVMARFLEESSKPRRLERNAREVSRTLQDYLDERNHPIRPLLTLDKNRHAVTVCRGGTAETYEIIDTDAFRALKVILDSRTNWVTSKAIAAELGGATRVDRLIRKLPEAVRALITRKPGTGYCIDLPA
jgi:hypothetical protein